MATRVQGVAMLLNLGCGEQYAEGWINVDHVGSPHRKDQEVDLVRALPWAPDSVGRVYLGHLLEHLRLSQCALLLTRLRRCMRYGGMVMVVGPDVQRAQQILDAGLQLEVPIEQLKKGAGRWAGDTHRWECTQDKLVRLLVEAGWDNVTPLSVGSVSTDWPVAFRGPTWQTAVQAERLQ